MFPHCWHILNVIFRNKRYLNKKIVFLLLLVFNYSPLNMKYPSLFCYWERGSTIYKNLQNMWETDAIIIKLQQSGFLEKWHFEPHDWLFPFPFLNRKTDNIISSFIFIQFQKSLPNGVKFEWLSGSNFEYNQ
mgnify:CR=1 FL=1